jgi:NAD(P)-dependent dehydrogenase (short-subunit alcohol dehydrogenase family)
MSLNDSFRLDGRVILITGANTGIGRVTARELARRGARVFLACRSAERTQAVLDDIRAVAPQAQAEWLPLDLGDFDSVRRCAALFLKRDLPLHVLINNAGVAGPQGLSASGFEFAFGVNHMGHFLLTQLLLERLGQSAPARIVTVASRAHRRVDGIDWDALRQRTRSFTCIREYATSKLANVLFSAELGRRLAGSGVSAYALHPGVVASDIWRQVPWPLRPLIELRGVSNEEGALTTLHCATSQAVAGETGLYYSRCQPTLPSLAGQDRALAAELWRRSEGWLAG